MEEKPRRRWTAIILSLLLAIAVAAISSAASFLIGGLVGQEQLYNSMAERQEFKMRVFQGQHPDVYGSLAIDRTTFGCAIFIGHVPSQKDRDLLKSEMQRLFGEEFGKIMTDQVEFP